jgi:peroxiredoxin Q/BCP
MLKKMGAVISSLFLSAGVNASTELKVNDKAPEFKAKLHDGTDFDLNSRKGQWTVLYFYPKANTPGCTKQACTLRDNIKKIRELGADVFGVSADSVEKQGAFHKEHHLNFSLIADEKGEVIALYGTKMPVVNMSKRWTFIIDPNLVIREIDKDVDPVADSEKVANRIKELQGKK